MKELVSPSAFEMVLRLLAVAGPILGLVAGVIAGLHGSLKSKMLGGLMIGCLGPAVYGLWWVYGMITDALGLDSVMNLCLQLLLFAALGVALGVAGIRISLMLRRLEVGE